MIRVENAGVAFGSHWIFRNVSLALERGELLAILGRNGRGKTTLLRALLGLEPWSSGRSQVDGAIGFVPQTAETIVNYSETSRMVLYIWGGVILEYDKAAGERETDKGDALKGQFKGTGGKWTLVADVGR